VFDDAVSYAFVWFASSHGRRLLTIPNPSSSCHLSAQVSWRSMGIALIGP
jgi:hypothetical protein